MNYKKFIGNLTGGTILVSAASVSLTPLAWVAWNAGPHDGLGARSLSAGDVAATLWCAGLLIQVVVVAFRLSWVLGKALVNALPDDFE